MNVLFPTFLAEDMHEIDNIDNGGTLSLLGAGLKFTEFEGDEEDTTTKNVGDLHVDNAVPIAFNHLTGSYTEALSSTPAGGSDQTASWGGTPIVRPAVSDTANRMKTFTDAASTLADRGVYMMGDYYPLNGKNSMPVVNHTDQGWLSLDTYYEAIADVDGEFEELPSTEVTPVTDLDNELVRGFRGGRLAEKNAGGGGANVTTGTRSGYKAPSKIANGVATNRVINGGALVLPALYGGSAEETHQIMLFLSAADNFGGAGAYKLMAAKTKYTVALHDSMGDVLPNPADDRVFGGAGGPELAGTSIIVEGIRVTTDAGACGGDEEDMIKGAWTVGHLISDIPTASSGAKEFAGLDAMLDPMKNASPGLIKFMRVGLVCKKEYGDGDEEDGNGVPAKDTRTFKGGTLIMEEPDTDRSFVTTGQALLKFLTSDATFAASWSLKSPPGPAN